MFMASLSVCKSIFLTGHLISTVMLDIGLEVIVYNQKGFQRAFLKKDIVPYRDISMYS